MILYLISLGFGITGICMHSWILLAISTSINALLGVLNSREVW
jgi:hypothetical protein